MFIVERRTLADQIAAVNVQVARVVWQSRSAGELAVVTDSGEDAWPGPGR